MKKRTYKKEHYFNKVGVMFLAFVFICYVNFIIRNFVNKESLVSPVVAEEIKPSVVISCDDPVGYIRCKYYSRELTEREATILIAIAKAESGLNPLAKNPKSSASGLFQVIAGTWYSYNCVGDKYDFKDSTNCAIKIMKKDKGFSAWSVYNNWTYKKHLKGVEI